MRHASFNISIVKYRSRSAEGHLDVTCSHLDTRSEQGEQARRSANKGRSDSIQLFQDIVFRFILQLYVLGAAGGVG